MPTLTELREEEYSRRLEVNRLRRELYEQRDIARTEALLEDLEAAEAALAEAEKARATQQVADPKASGLIVDTDRPTSLLGPQTTGLDAKVHLRMSHVPTAICHLLQKDRDPLLSCRVDNLSNEIRRVRLTSFVEGYSARAVDTFEIRAAGDHEFEQLPTFFPESVRAVTELTRATLNVLVEDLDGKVEMQVTEPIWLLARNAAPLAIQDPMTGAWKDMTPYFAAFVTPNAPAVMQLLRRATAYHPDARLIGPKAAADPQAKALFETLKQETEIRYVNSLIAFGAQEGFTMQRVRLPRETLAEKQANCIDGTILFASLLEGISLKPAIVSIPQHAFVGWQVGDGAWNYLDTTMIDTHSFEDACRWANVLAKRYEGQAEATGDTQYFQRHALPELRAHEGITPME